jgi:hypothetical protein
METVCFSETMVSTDKSTWRHKPEEKRRHLHRRENLKSHIKETLLTLTTLTNKSSSL